jgi:hypothetical protein
MNIEADIRTTHTPEMGNAREEYEARMFLLLLPGEEAVMLVSNM